VSDNTILVRIAEDIDEAEFRVGKVRELSVDELTENVNQFLARVESMLRNTPAVVADFRFVELEVSAEGSAEGNLSLMGAGVGVTARGGLTFRFHSVIVARNKPRNSLAIYGFSTRPAHRLSL
jgi:hypothetical protein